MKLIQSGVALGQVLSLNPSKRLGGTELLAESENQSLPTSGSEIETASLSLPENTQSPVEPRAPLESDTG